jgi:hypothetical protein
MYRLILRRAAIIFTDTGVLDQKFGDHCARLLHGVHHCFPYRVTQQQVHAMFMMTLAALPA